LRSPPQRDPPHESKDEHDFPTTPVHRGALGSDVVNLLAWLAIGTALGWLAGRMTRAEDPQGALANVLVGTVGALVGGYLIGPLVEPGPIDRAGFGGASLLLAATGAVLLLGVFGLARRGTLR
jgi:uncharacterized membrane protein YeaQ/YmgE (transglycosylase-associated protein family)